MSYTRRIHLLIFIGVGGTILSYCYFIFKIYVVSSLIRDVIGVFSNFIEGKLVRHPGPSRHSFL